MILAARNVVSCMVLHFVYVVNILLNVVCFRGVAALVKKLQDAASKDDVKVTLRVLRDEIGRVYFARYSCAFAMGWCDVPRSNCFVFHVASLLFRCHILHGLFSGCLG
jgi:hypothetical protein